MFSTNPDTVAVDEEIDSPKFTNHVGKAAKKSTIAGTSASTSAAGSKTTSPRKPKKDAADDDDDDIDDTSSSDEAGRARKAIAAAAAKKQRAEDKHIFSGLDKFLADGESEPPALKLDDIDAVSDRSSLSSDCELLDTSMFKSSAKNKHIDDRKLSRIMRNSQRRNADANAVAAAAAASAAAIASTSAGVAGTSKPMADDCISLSSDTDLDLDEDVVEVPNAGDGDREGGGNDDEAGAVATSSQQSNEKNRAPRKMLRADQLADATKSAQTEEKERVKRLEKKAERLAQLEKSRAKDKDKTTEAPASSGPRLEESDVVLDYDSKAKCRITVHPDIVRHLKPHQVDGIKFMYDSCYGSVDDKSGGSGCILAHCMGLGKTLQLIALLHTLIRHVQLKTNKILVICPKSTVMNWAEEIERWLGPVRGGPSVKVYQFPDSS